MRTFDSLSAAITALTQFGYVYVAQSPVGYGFSKSGKHAVVKARGTGYIVKFI